MLYVQQSLGPDEHLIHVGEFHWMHSVHAVMAIFWGMLASALMIVGTIYVYKQQGWIHPATPLLPAIQLLHPGARIGALLFFVFGLLNFAQMMVTKASTEIAVTNKRLIYKRGLVARFVGELRVDRIEGVNVLQSVLGRMFNYGRLAVRGTGVGEVVLPPIEDPLAFRQAIERAKTA